MWGTAKIVLRVELFIAKPGGPESEHELPLNVHIRIYYKMPSPRAKTHQTSKAKEFDELLLTSIDNALISLGESVKKSIYYHLEEQFGLKREQIPKHITKFQTANEKIFGSGARLLEILIMKNLYIKAGVTVSMKEGVSFADYLKELKHVYTKKLD